MAPEAFHSAHYVDGALKVALSLWTPRSVARRATVSASG